MTAGSTRWAVEQNGSTAVWTAAVWGIGHPLWPELRRLAPSRRSDAGVKAEQAAREA